MNSKGINLLATMLAMSMDTNPYHSLDRPRELHPNEKRKCFRKGCANNRVGRESLYCSDECKKRYREEYKISLIFKNKTKW